MFKEQSTLIYCMDSIRNYIFRCLYEVSLKEISQGYHTNVQGHIDQPFLTRIDCADC
jgi:hypothetical protein